MVPSFSAVPILPCLTDGYWQNLLNPAVGFDSCPILDTNASFDLFEFYHHFKESQKPNHVCEDSHMPQP